VFVKALQFLLLFMQRSPAETRRDCRFVILALDHELRAAIVKTEDLIGEIETVGDESQPTGQSNAALRIDLEVGIEIVVAEGTTDSAHGSVSKSIGGDIRRVIGQAHANRDANAVISRADIPGVGCVAQESWMIERAKSGPKEARDAV